MEVASPLSFAHVKPGSKRRYACSPIMDSTATIDDHDFQMDDSAAYGQNFKRRRCDNDDMGMGQMISTNPFIPMNNNHNHSPFGSSSFGGSATGNKRQRAEDSQSLESTIKYLQSMVEKQNEENARLRSEKECVEQSYHELSATHEKVVNENKVLKKVLSIKQERQDHVFAELDELRRYKEHSEHALTVLRQHLSSQQLLRGFGGFNDGSPDVY